MKRWRLTVSLEALDAASNPLTVVLEGDVDEGQRVELNVTREVEGAGNAFSSSGKATVEIKANGVMR